MNKIRISVAFEILKKLEAELKAWQSQPVLNRDSQDQEIAKIKIPLIFNPENPGSDKERSVSDEHITIKKHGEL
jgi:hypothetical protein